MRGKMLSLEGNFRGNGNFWNILCLIFHQYRLFNYSEVSILIFSVVTITVFFLSKCFISISSIVREKNVYGYLTNFLCLFLSQSSKVKEETYLYVRISCLQKKKRAI